jgi:AraC-like DNA-binding protein
MTATTFRLFSEPDEFAAAIRPAQAQVTATQRGRYGARLSLVDLDQVALRTFEVNLSQLSRNTLSPETTVLSFLLEPVGGAYIGGEEFQSGILIKHAVGRDYYLRTTGPTVLVHLLLPHVIIDGIGGNSGGAQLMSRDTRAVIPQVQALSKLRRLHGAAMRLAQDAPEVLSHAGAARGLEQALIEAVSDCFAGAEPQILSFGRRKQEAIMRRFNRLMEEHWDEGLFIPEICERLGVSIRSFRMYCMDQFGMGAKRFLLLRRMHLVRRRLIEAKATQTAVTEIATEYCFWELGRFAVVYKLLFGESPSETLRRSPIGSLHQSTITMHPGMQAAE